MLRASIVALWLFTSGVGLAAGAPAVPQAPPANDDLAAAVVVTGLPFGYRQNTREATAEAGELPPSCRPDAGRSVWFRFTPARDGRMRITTFGSRHGAILSVWLGSGHPAQQLTCSASENNSTTAVVTLAVSQGVTYLVKVEAVGAGGDLVLYTSNPDLPPANDNLASATVIGALPFTERVNTTAATMEPNEVASACDAQGGKSVWYGLTLPDKTSVRLDTRTSSYDTVLSVWTGTRHPLQFVLCNDDEADTTASAATFTAEAGVTYLVRVDGLDGEAGELTLHAEEVERAVVGRVFLPLLANRAEVARDDW